jgi:PAS domain S-box-containing protein
VEVLVKEMIVQDYNEEDNMVLVQHHRYGGHLIRRNVASKLRSWFIALLAPHTPFPSSPLPKVERLQPIPPPSYFAHPMFQADNFFAFHDLTPEGRILWVSPSIYDVLGYEPEELVGVSGYDLLCPDDHAEGKEIHKETCMSDLVASQMFTRFKAKDGRAVHSMSVFSLCYDFVINSVTVLDSTVEMCKLGS